MKEAGDTGGPGVRVLRNVEKDLSPAPGDVTPHSRLMVVNIARRNLMSPGPVTTRNVRR